jgi:hypothetical protein
MNYRLIALFILLTALPSFAADTEQVDEDDMIYVEPTWYYVLRAGNGLKSLNFNQTGVLGDASGSAFTIKVPSIEWGLHSTTDWWASFRYEYFELGMTVDGANEKSKKDQKFFELDAKLGRKAFYIGMSKKSSPVLQVINPLVSTSSKAKILSLLVGGRLSLRTKAKEDMPLLFYLGGELELPFGIEGTEGINASSVSGMNYNVDLTMKKIFAVSNHYRYFVEVQGGYRVSDTTSKIKWEALQGEVNRTITESTVRFSLGLDY